MMRQRACVISWILAGLALGAWAAGQSVATTAPTSQPAQAEPAEAPRVGWIELSGRLHEAPPPFAWLSEGGDSRTLRGVLALLHSIAFDEHYKGCVIYLDEPELEMSQIEELSEGILEVRAHKKKVLVFAEQYDLRGYLLACAADEILLQRKGLLEFSGLDVEEIYLAGLLEKIGIKADFLQVGRFKGAQEPFTRSGPSPEWSQNMDALLDNLYQRILLRVAETRRLNFKQVEQAMADCWTMSDEEYVRRKLVDRLASRDLVEVTEDVFGEEFVWDDDIGQESSSAHLDNPFAVLSLLLKGPAERITRPTIALIYANGPITSGDAGSRAPLGRVAGNTGLLDSSVVGSRTIVRALGEARDNDLVRGIVIRIDSPGGSAMASEVIWQAMREVGQDKPVYVSIGSMAASGGYYVACGGQRIYASDSSILGSIGVVGGKFILGDLYNKIGLNIHRRSRGPLGDMFNSVAPFTPEQRAAMQGAFDRVYAQFVDRVQQGRGERIKQMDEVAQGRLFTGRQALANGMIDHIGGVERAIADMAGELKLRSGEFDVVNLPEPMTLPEFIEQLFGVRAPMAGAAPGSLEAARAALGPRVWAQVQAVLAGYMLLQHEPVLTLLPAAVVVR